MIATWMDQRSLMEMDAAAATIQGQAAQALAVLREDALERPFALSLLRHAKGVRAAVAAWQQELKNR